MEKLNRKIKTNPLFTLALLGIVIFAWQVQNMLFLNWDVGTLLNAAEQMLTGGDYLHNFFTPNPPMIIYLYAPVAWIHQHLYTNMALDFKIYIFLIAALSFSLCYSLAKKIFADEDQVIKQVFLSTLLFCFLVIPLYEFGQRDHLFFMLSMPYLLLVSCRLQEKTISSLQAVSIGILAGLVFSLKPQFFILPLIVELYSLCNKRIIKSLARPEIFAIISTVTIYLLVVAITRQDYLTIVLPYLLRNYYKSSQSPLSMLSNSPIVIFAWTILPTYFTLHYVSRYRHLINLLFLSLLVFVSIFFLQKTMYYYHSIPTFSIALLITTFTFTGFVTKTSRSLISYISLAATAFILLAVFFWKWSLITTYVVNNPYVFFCFFAGLFLLLVNVATEFNYKFETFLLVTLAIVLSYDYSSAISSTPFYPHHFSLTILFLFLLFSLLISKYKQSIIRYNLYAIVGMILFAPTAMILVAMNNKGLSYKKETLTPLITYINQQPLSKRSFYSFSLSTNFSFPLTYYSQSQAKDRFDCLWMIKGLINNLRKNGDKFVIEKFKTNQDTLFFVKLITNDLNEKKPELVFVETIKPYYVQFPQYFYFDYLKYFSVNSDFQKAWQHYHYATTLDTGFYKVKVFKRNDS